MWLDWIDRELVLHERTIPVNWLFPLLPIQTISLFMVLAVYIPVVQQHLWKSSRRLDLVMVATDLRPLSFACCKLVLTWICWQKTEFLENSIELDLLYQNNSIIKGFSSLLVRLSEFCFSKTISKGWWWRRGQRQGFTHNYFCGGGGEEGGSLQDWNFYAYFFRTQYLIFRSCYKPNPKSSL